MTEADDEFKNMMGCNAKTTFLEGFRVGTYAGASVQLKKCWLWYTKDICGKVSRSWGARVKLFKKLPHDDVLCTYLAISDEAFAQLCIILYHEDFESRLQNTWVAKKGRKKGASDLGSKEASKLYTELFLALKKKRTWVWEVIGKRR